MLMQKGPTLDVGQERGRLEFRLRVARIEKLEAFQTCRMP